MAGFNLKNALVSIAPALASMLGSPLAGTAVAALESAFGLTAGSGTDGITQVMQSGQMTPEIIANVRAADQKHAELMAQQGIDMAKLNADFQSAIIDANVKDRDSARQREIAVKDQTPARLAYMVIGGFFGVSIAQLIALMFFPDYAAKIPSQGWLLIGNISGYLAAEAKSAASYYFGTTQASNDKNDMIYNSTPTDAPK